MFRVYRSLDAIGPEARTSAVSVGNFDGVHAGHRRLLARNLEVARTHRWRPSVLTFDPHPTRIVAPERAPKLLTSIEQRIELIREAGIEQVFVIAFDRHFSELSPEEFVRSVLVDAAGARAVLVGENFRFGHRQTGDTHTLRELGTRYGFLTEIVPGVTVRGHFASSSTARRFIESGDVSRAARLLLRPYALEGVVVSGFGIGSKQTVPTLNLDTAAEVLPARGVYVTRTYDLDSDSQWPSVTNVGTRPTFNGDQQTIETYLLAPPGERTPERIRVEFLLRLRDERRFETPEQLRAQILRDVARAQSWHRRTRSFTRAL